VAFYEFEGIVPVIDPTSFVHETAVVIGDVVVEANCFVGPGAVLRGDLARIEMRDGSNVQDNCVVHSFWGKDTIIQRHGHVGHGAVIHGCTIGENALIGINSVVMDDAVIGKNSWVAALTFVKSETKIPPNLLVVGCPSKIVRELTKEDIEKKSKGTSNYHHLCKRFPISEKRCEPLAQLNSNRGTMPEPM
jgi:phenylacetic acid degradation protein